MAPQAPVGRHADRLGRSQTNHSLLTPAVVKHTRTSRRRPSMRLNEDEARWFFQQLVVGLDYCHRWAGVVGRGFPTPRQTRRAMFQFRAPIRTRTCERAPTPSPRACSRGVANRDLKLENLLLDSADTPYPILKMCDFGYSKVRSGPLVQREGRFGAQEPRGAGTRSASSCWALLSVGRTRLHASDAARAEQPAQDKRGHHVLHGPRGVPWLHDVRRQGAGGVGWGWGGGVGEGE